MATADHPDVPFVEARTQAGGPAYTVDRPDGPPIWVVVHDMEYPERDNAAEWTANYFATGAGGRSVSSHYCADNTSIVQCVRLRDSAWTVGNRPGNYRGVNWELAGYAAQTREQWLDPFGLAMLDRAAIVMRRDMDTYNIPARLLTDAQVKAFAPGVTSHAQLGRCFGGTSHTDPGKNFPWDHLIKLLGGDMSEVVDQDVLQWRVEALVYNRETVGGPTPAAGQPNLLRAQLDRIEAKLDQLLAQGSTGGATLAQVEDLLKRTGLAVRPADPGSGT